MEGSRGFAKMLSQSEGDIPESSPGMSGLVRPAETTSEECQSTASEGSIQRAGRCWTMSRAGGDWMKDREKSNSIPGRCSVREGRFLLQHKAHSHEISPNSSFPYSVKIRSQIRSHRDLFAMPLPRHRSTPGCLRTSRPAPHGSTSLSRPSWRAL